MGWGGRIPWIENGEQISTVQILSAELRNTKLPFHVFIVDDIPNSRFSNLIRPNSMIFWHASFPTFSIFEILIFTNICKTWLETFLVSFFVFFFFVALLQSRSQEELGLGSWTFPLSPKTLKTQTFRIFGKWRWKLTSSSWSRIKQNNYTELLAFPKFTIEGKNGQADPIRPQIGYFSISSIESLSSPYRALNFSVEHFGRQVVWRVTGARDRYHQRVPPEGANNATTI